MHRGQPTRGQMITAALTYGGSHALLTGLEAVARYGVRRLPEHHHVHLLVPHGCHIGSRDFVVVERTRRMPPALQVSGLPLAPVARCLVDAARRMSRTDEVRAMIADAVQRDLCSVGALAEELAQPRLPGSALPRLVLDEIGDGVRSAAEGWARSLVLRGTGMPAPTWNMAIRSASGQLLAVVDAWWDDAGLAWEIDSHEFHLSPADHERTTRRQSALAAAGVMVVRTVPSRLRHDAAAVLREVESAYRQARRSPRPDVHASPWHGEPGRPKAH